MLILLIVLGLVFNFLNGYLGSSSSVATIISSRAMSPRVALLITGIAVFCGPFLLGTAVARTLATTLITVEAINLAMITAALASSILWSLLTWFFAIPSSPSHALIGGLVGAAWMSAGFGAVQTNGFLKVLLALLISPALGLLAGMFMTRLVYLLARRASLKINWWFRNGQYLTGLGLALSNGANDGPKGMGVIALGLMAANILPGFTVPLWVLLTSAAAMALGNLLGGWRIIKTLGGKFYRIRPVDSFCSQIAAAGVIFSAALLGGPVSTTQVISSAILGVGAAERLNKVRWSVALNIALTWLVTIPVNILLAGVLYLLLQWLK